MKSPNCCFLFWLRKNHRNLFENKKPETSRKGTFLFEWFFLPEFIFVSSVCVIYCSTIKLKKEHLEFLLHCLDINTKLFGAS